MQRIGVEGRLVIAFTMAGGMIVSGLLVVAGTLSGSMSPSGLLSTTCLLFLVGTVIGWLHAVLLGFAGHQDGTTARNIIKHILTAGLLSLPFLLLAMIAAAGVALSGLAVQSGAIAPLFTAAVCWLITLGVCLWAMLVGLEAWRNACARHPEGRIGGVLLVLLALALIVAFEHNHPLILGTNYHVTAIGAVILAVGTTIWIGAPVLLSLLHLVYTRLPQKRKAASI